MMLIGELARESGFSRDTIRYYEKSGLLPKVPQSANGYKIYSQETLQRLQHISQLKQSGFTLEEIQGLLSGFQSSDPCAGLPALLDEKIAQIEVKIAQLLHYQKSLQIARQACSSACKSSNSVPTCLNNSPVQFYSPDA